MVEAFVALHPDLKEELDVLLQTKFLPDQHIIFDNKEELLLLNTSAFDINTTNYEEWLVMYMDNELNEGQMAAVDNFVLHNPEVQKELQLLQKTKLLPQDVIFPDKKSLYRTERVRRIPAWWRMAAAAAIVTAIGTTAIVMLNNRPPAAAIDPIAKTTGTEKKSQTNPVTAEQGQKAQPVAVEPATSDKNNNELLTADNNTRQAKSAVITEERSAPLATNNITPVTNNLTTPDQNPNVNPSLKTEEGFTNTKKDLTTPIETINTTPVTKPLSKSYIDRPDVPITAVYDPSEETGDDEPTGKKNKLRGFFRKVTRTFEKRTSIDATDGEDRLLVAGLSIKLK